MTSVKQDGENAHLFWSMTTEYFADSVEWCPLHPYQHIFVCGQYQLEENGDSGFEQSRIGAVYLFQADIHAKKCTRLQTVSTSGVLDMKWCPYRVGGHYILGIATASGTIELYSLVEKEEDEKDLNVLHLQFMLGKKPSPFSHNLMLSLDWYQDKEFPEKTLLIASESSGKIYLMHLNDAELKVLSSTQAHAFQAWISCFDYHSAGIVYSGGDDTLLKGWDTRTEMHRPLFINKSHSMGVTCLQCSRKKEFLLASGSYDETIRLWDTRKIKEPTAEVKVGGGIWRLKWEPYADQHLLAACNENGTKIIKVQANFSEDFSMQVVASNNSHSSLAYGADWCWLSSMPAEDTDTKRNTYVVASCSFYDKHLCLWETVLSDVSVY